MEYSAPKDLHPHVSVLSRRGQRASAHDMEASGALGTNVDRRYSKSAYVRQPVTCGEARRSRRQDFDDFDKDFSCSVLCYLDHGSHIGSGKTNCLRNRGGSCNMIGGVDIQFFRDCIAMISGAHIHSCL
jgi:hypothetical protein